MNPTENADFKLQILLSDCRPFLAIAGAGYNQGVQALVSARADFFRSALTESAASRKGQLTLPPFSTPRTI